MAGESGAGVVNGMVAVVPVVVVVVVVGVVVVVVVVVVKTVVNEPVHVHGIDVFAM